MKSAIILVLALLGCDSEPPAKNCPTLAVKLKPITLEKANHQHDVYRFEIEGEPVVCYYFDTGSAHVISCVPKLNPRCAP